MAAKEEMNNDKMKAEFSLLMEKLMGMATKQELEEKAGDYDI
jgi:hypothetical protein